MVREDICRYELLRYVLFKMIPTARVCALHCEEEGGRDMDMLHSIVCNM